MHCITEKKNKEMFGSKKKENNTTSKGSMIPGGASHSLNTLVKGTLIEGTVKSESDIRIDGTIKGSLTCDAKVIIGPSGFVEGEIKCENAVIEGRFEGNLSVTDLLNVRETAYIQGDVRTNKLIVQSGAVFNVGCKMGSSSNEYSKVKENIVQTAAKQKVGLQE